MTPERIEQIEGMNWLQYTALAQEEKSAFISQLDRANVEMVFNEAELMGEMIWH